MPKTRKKPQYTHHQATNQARVRIGGKDHYLGEYGSPESRDRYDDLIAEWFAFDGQDDKVAMPVDDLCLLSMQRAEAYYRQNDGSPTGEPSSLKHAIGFLLKNHGRVPVRQFGLPGSEL